MPVWSQSVKQGACSSTAGYLDLFLLFNDYFAGHVLVTLVQAFGATMRTREIFGVAPRCDPNMSL